MKDESYAKFGKFRSYLWPIHGNELKKLLPMLCIAFLTALIYNILRIMKDGLIVTAAESAEVIPFVKVWAMLPIAILATSIFVKLSHRHSSEKVFYYITSGFLVFFAIFCFVLYPIRESLHLHAFADYLQTVLPKGLGGMIGLVRYWSYGLFYAMAEIWGTICLTILFWGFANEVTKVSEAKRFYGLLALGANFSSIPAGFLTLKCLDYTPKTQWLGTDDPYQYQLALVTFTIIAAGGLLIWSFRKFNKKVVSKLDLPANHHNPKLDKLESKPSMTASFKTLMRSKYLTSISVVVISYNLVINLVEVLWKEQVRTLYPDKHDFQAYMSYITSATGVVATLMALIVSGNMIRKCGWTATALFTPIMILLTSIGFFVFYLAPEGSLVFLTGGATELSMVVLIGAIQNCFSRAAKFTVFDETKEMCFIPLSRQEKIRGKAAIDGVGSRLGKSGGSLIYQGMFLVFEKLAASAPYVAILLGFLFAGWMGAVRRLGRQFKTLTEEPTEEKAPVPQEQAV